MLKSNISLANQHSRSFDKCDSNQLSFDKCDSNQLFANAIITQSNFDINDFLFNIGLTKRRFAVALFFIKELTKSNKKTLTISQSEIAERLSIPQQTISRILRELLNKKILNFRRTKLYTYTYWLHPKFIEKLSIACSTFEQSVYSLKNENSNTDQSIADEAVDGGTKMSAQESYTHAEYINNKSYKSNKSKNSFLEKPKNTTCQDMIAAWNEITGIKTTLTKEIARFLVAAMKFKFKTLEAWKRFCWAIKKSSYFLKSKFRLTLRWFLDFTNIGRIFNGEYGCYNWKEQEKIDPETGEIMAVSVEEQKEAQQDFSEHMEKLDETEECKEVRKKLAKKIGRPNYLSWFSKIGFVERDGAIEIVGASNFVQDKISAHFSGELYELGLKFASKYKTSAEQGKLEYEQYQQELKLKRGQCMMKNKLRKLGVLI